MKRKINPHIKRIKKARKLERWANFQGLTLNDVQILCDSVAAATDGRLTASIVSDPNGCFINVRGVVRDN